MIWWWTDRRLIPPAVDSQIESRANEVFESGASAWEIATKARLGKLAPMLPHLDKYREAVAASDFATLAMADAHGLRAGSYDVDHRDPFDRMLAAQAELDGMTLVTRDPAFAGIPCATLWV